MMDANSDFFGIFTEIISRRRGQSDFCFSSSDPAHALAVSSA